MLGRNANVENMSKNCSNHDLNFELSHKQFVLTIWVQSIDFCWFNTFLKTNMKQGKNNINNYLSIIFFYKQTHT